MFINNFILRNNIFIVLMPLMIGGCGGISNSRLPAKVDNEVPKKDARRSAKKQDSNSSAVNIFYVLQNTTAISRQGTSGSTPKDDLSRPGPQKSTITTSPSSDNHNSDGHQH